MLRSFRYFHAHSYFILSSPLEEFDQLQIAYSSHVPSVQWARVLAYDKAFREQVAAARIVDL